MRSSSRADRLLGLLLPTLAVVAEGAWITVAYVAIETTIDRRPPLLGTFELAVAASLSALLARRGWLKPDDHPLAFLAYLAAIGGVGWLWDASARQLLLVGDPIGAISVHPGGWLAIVAAMRGVGYAIDVDDRAVTRLVLMGVPALAIPWTLGQVAAGPLQPVFVEEAFVASLTFVAAGFMAAGLARLQEIGRETGIDWRHDRSWLGTVLGVLVVVLALGIPAAMLLGLQGDAVARGILGPIVSILTYGLIVVLTATALVAAVLATALTAVGFQLPAPMTPEELARLPLLREYTAEELRQPLTWLAAVWVVIALVLVVLLRIWVRRRKLSRRRADTEERSFRLPPRSIRTPAPAAIQARRASRRGGEPIDAVGAYLASVEALGASDEAIARREHETPRAHARRIAARHELVTLQADYALARYANRQLTAAEHRRALGRWRRIRDAVGRLH